MVAVIQQLLVTEVTAAMSSHYRLKEISSLSLKAIELPLYRKKENLKEYSKCWCIEKECSSPCCIGMPFSRAF